MAARRHYYDEIVDPILELQERSTEGMPDSSSGIELSTNKGDLKKVAEQLFAMKTTVKQKSEGDNEEITGTVVHEEITGTVVHEEITGTVVHEERDSSGEQYSNGSEAIVEQPTPVVLDEYSDEDISVTDSDTKKNKSEGKFAGFLRIFRKKKKRKMEPSNKKTIQGSVVVAESNSSAQVDYNEEVISSRTHFYDEINYNGSTVKRVEEVKKGKEDTGENINKKDFRGNCDKLGGDAIIEKETVDIETNEIDNPNKKEIDEVPEKESNLNSSTEKRPFQQAVFTELTVDELSNILKSLGLDSFANNCETHLLDGAFFEDVTVNDLTDEPFNLSKLDALKFIKMKNRGWTPNR